MTNSNKVAPSHASCSVLEQELASATLGDLLPQFLNTGEATPEGPVTHSEPRSKPRRLALSHLSGLAKSKSTLEQTVVGEVGRH